MWFTSWLVAGCTVGTVPKTTTHPSDTPSTSSIPPSTSSTPDPSSSGSSSVETGSGSGSSSPGGDSSAPDDSAQQLCVDTINAYRATLSLPPYDRWDSAESCADGQAQADYLAGVYHSAFGQCGEWAQDECPGWPSPPEGMIEDCLALMWAEGPGTFTHHGHYVNMSSTSYTKVACGYYTTPDGAVWATQDFQ